MKKSQVITTVMSLVVVMSTRFASPLLATGGSSYYCGPNVAWGQLLSNGLYECEYAVGCDGNSYAHGYCDGLDTMGCGYLQDYACTSTGVGCWWNIDDCP